MDTTTPDLQASSSRAPFHRAVLVTALIALVAHLLMTTGYGLGGDELTAIASSDHPSPGYLDIGPLPVLLLALQRLIGGDGVFAIRCLSAVLCACTVYVTGILARRMGAGAFGQFLAALCVLIAPALVLAGHIATPFGFAVLAWATGTYLIVRIAEESTPRLWILLGVVTGLGFLSSFTMAFFVVAAAVGFLATPLRRHLGSAWPWAGAATAVVILLPWILWQASHGWPTAAWVHASYTEASGMQPLAFVLEQIKLRQPLTLPVWLGGVVALLFTASFRPWRVVVWMYLAAAIMLFVARMEPHYLIPASAGLVAAGAAAAEGVLKKVWMRLTVAVVLCAGGILTLPMGLPVLPARTFIEYEKSIHFRLSMGSNECTDRLPGYYGTMFGRKELAVVMNAVFTTLPPEERGQYGILCEDAVQAAALNFYGKEYHLPRAVSGSDQFWYWGPGDVTGERLVVVGGNADGLQGIFREVSMRMRFRDEYLHPGNAMTPVWLVARPVAPLPQLWDRLQTVK